MNQQQATKRKENPAHKPWRCQVWANYHYGNMTTEAAEAAAGPEPERWIEVEVQQ